ncbi:REP element-mobilizing transposase RayT [Caloramator fervidus]|uniref:REP element-mobilizing transposase RayT n=1 Tax=Caloramator fervidus TaxID=29344 RepID=A0A1H5RM92_9CLOT|nr:transposase [Caloramator fervidus]SEF38848.1 REP element-mobilizing transposase RayT [Caloramator fervidus]
MPRCARVKTNDAIYHVMCKSISDTPLFRNDTDKDMFLAYIKKYQQKYQFKVYAYCLMTNHVHLIIDSNGFDISKIMHGVNQSYAQYFNRKYKRKGHLFHDRFKSIVVKDDRYLVTLSAYIHNNPIAMKEYRECPEKYKYSSLAVYLGIRKDPFGILDEGFIMAMFSRNVKKARERYYKFVLTCSDVKVKKFIEFEDYQGEYRSNRIVLKRQCSPQEIFKFVEENLDIDTSLIYLKHSRKAKEYRAIIVYLLRCFCGYTYSEICKVLGDITLSRVAVLFNIGFELVNCNSTYKNLVKKFLNEKVV